MIQSKKTIQQQLIEARRAKKKRERIILLLICVCLAVLIGSGTLYHQQSSTIKPVAQQPAAASALNQGCQNKLLEYIRQGGVDLEAKMQHGDLQGCDFSSPTELARQAESKKSWSMK